MSLVYKARLKRWISQKPKPPFSPLDMSYASSQSSGFYCLFQNHSTRNWPEFDQVFCKIPKTSLKQENRMESPKLPPESTLLCMLLKTIAPSIPTKLIHFFFKCSIKILTCSQIRMRDTQIFFMIKDHFDIERIGNDNLC